MPDAKSMDKYQKMLDEIAGKYPELEDAVADFTDELMGSMDAGESDDVPAGDDPVEEGAEADDAGGELPPFMKKGPKAPAPADEEETDEPEDEEDYQF